VAAGQVAFVLGGGGHLGAHEVGMLRALLERGIAPDRVVGTSIGAINGAAVASDPTPDAIGRLAEVWSRIERSDAFGGSLLGRLGTLARSRTHLHDNEPLRRMLEDWLPVERIEDLPVPFQCVAASIERAAEHWFGDGPLAEAVLASCAVPGLLAPVRIGDEHYLDGGLVNSVPVSRAVELGARTVYVLQVGRVERPLTPPKLPWQVALVAFEIARRHRFAADLARLPSDVTVHVLPTGDVVPEGLRQLRYRDAGRTAERVENAYRASADYLAQA
jgi:NTE family protein